MILSLLMSLFHLSLDLLAILALPRVTKIWSSLSFADRCAYYNQRKTPPRISDPERMILATLTDKPIVHTPDQSPRAIAIAEQWVHPVREVREECLNPNLILNGNHLRRVHKEYGEYYNHTRPHQGIGQGFPVSGHIKRSIGPIRWRDILGGIIHDYSRQRPIPVSGFG